jgi:hypothetical protein
LRFRQSEGSWEGALVAYWEVDGDPISDDFTPDEINAKELLARWAKIVSAKYPDGAIPIWWFVDCEEEAKLAAFPFARHPESMPADLRDEALTIWSWPEHVVTGERLNWLTLPVVDKLWHAGRSDKGGFIQEATRWKPSIAQPFLYLPSLLRSDGGA